MKKLFGGINLTWPKLILFSIIAGLYGGFIALLPAARDTSFTDMTVTFEVWILFGIIIIMNSKSPLDSGLKCFIFFLISQPLIYIVQDVITGSNLFHTYYRFWVLWTIACFPMGFIGYFMKKDKWWGVFILIPILILLGEHYSAYLSKTMFSFPLHLLTTIFCFGTLILYPICIFKNKIAREIGLVTSITLIIIFTFLTIKNPPVYDTYLLSSGDKYTFDDSYKAYLEDSKYGDMDIVYDQDTWTIHVVFKKAGNTKFILESPDGKKRTFKIKIERDYYDFKEIKNKD
ncbi:MAG: hypothetical protein IKE73_00325 [Bacilli bacterium]|nr:hypothetical protein [Bacilli bacterium]